MTISNSPHDNRKHIERFADVMTHGVGLILSILAFLALILKAAFSNNTWVFISFSIYGMSLISTYLSSTMYHLYVYYHKVPNKSFRRLLLLFDHSSIFLLIAGSYTPIILVFMRTSFGWSLFILIWALTILGIIYKIYFLGRFKRFSLIMYTSMSWLIIFAMNRLLALVPHALIKYLLVGGVFYTIGIIFFQKKNISFNHAIWHLFVLIGSIIHFFGMILFIP